MRLFPYRDETLSVRIHRARVRAYSAILIPRIFFEKLRASSWVRPSRKASSRAIPVITTTSIFVKSLSALSSSLTRAPGPFHFLPSFFFRFLFLFHFCLGIDQAFSISRFINSIARAEIQERASSIFQIINFYEGSRVAERVSPLFLYYFLFTGPNPRASFSLPL